VAYTEQDKKDHIREVQGYLRTIDRANDVPASIIPDGAYGRTTGEAVRRFQREHSLPVTGSVDWDTWSSIAEAYLSALEQLDGGSGIMLAAGGGALKEGDSGERVYILQAVLNTVAGHYSNLDSIEVDGVYGKSTADAVKKLQEIVGEPVNGTADSRTIGKLARLYNYHIAADGG